MIVLLCGCAQQLKSFVFRTLPFVELLILATAQLANVFVAFSSCHPLGNIRRTRTLTAR